MKKELIVLAALLALAAGCAAPAEAPEGGYRVYYSALSDRYADLAVDWVNHVPEDEASPIQELLDALLAEPESTDLTSPFPDGVRVLDWSVSEGVLTLDLSEQYGGLSGVDLAVADACLALTLCQVEGVNSVYVTVEGREVPYRPIQLLRAEDVLLSRGIGEPIPTPEPSTEPAPS